MYKIEFLAPDGVVVGFFEVAPTIPLASLGAKIEEALKVNGAHVLHWQVHRPDESILCRVKVQAV